jgi:hypothetical protein
MPSRILVLRLHIFESRDAHDMKKSKAEFCYLAADEMRNWKKKKKKSFWKRSPSISR